MSKLVAESFRKHPIKMTIGAALDLGGLVLIVAFLVGAL